MAPFGETVLAWRLLRGLTQAQLAIAAGVSRPNLSAIERGDREVTLRTLRALALALDVRPGVLVDGVLPRDTADGLGRPTLERLAKATLHDGAVPPGTSARETAIVRALRSSSRVRRFARQGRPGRKGVGADRAYFLLRAMERAETVASLFDRVEREVERE